jgi:hypothetical protein
MNDYDCRYQDNRWWTVAILDNNEVFAAQV